MTVNEKLRNTTIRHSIYMEQLKNNEVKKIIALLNKTDVDLRKQLLKRKGATPTITSKRLELMKKDVAEIIADAKQIYTNNLTKTATGVAQSELNFTNNLIKNAIPEEVPISFIQPAPSQIMGAIKATPFANTTTQTMIADWALQKKNTFTNAIQQAYVQGKNIDDVVSILFGSRKFNYTDGLVDSSRRQVRTQVRTAINHFASTSREIIYAENQDIIKGVQWVSTLDGRTTLLCMNLDGKVDYADGSKNELNGQRPPAHYNCYHKDTEVYTDKGWKLFSKLDGTERCLSFNPDNESEQKFIKPINYIKYRHKGQLISIKSNDFSMSVTPDHNMLLKYRGEGASNKYRFVQAKDMPKWNNRIYRGVSWTGNNATTARLGDYEIDAQLYCKFMGYYLSEGSTTKASKNCYYSGISQFKHVDKMYEELKELPFNVTKVSEGINIYDASVGEDLRKYGHSYEKYVPQVIKDMSKENIEVFLNAYILGDGSKLDADAFGYKVEGFKIVFTSSSRMAEDIGELIMKVGGRPSYTLLKRKGKECTFKNGTYTTNHDIWQINWCKNLYSQTENLKKEYFDYDDFVYCVELPEWHSLFIRYEGKVAWSGNCRSTTVPVIKSLKEMGLSDKEFSKGTRASMNGQVPETETYKTWFAKQDEAFQRKTLGKGKYELYKNGGYTLDKFVDNGQTLTLKQLGMLDNPKNPAGTFAPFTEQKTVKSAEEWMKDKLGFEGVSYKGADISAVNEMNKSVYDNFSMFPELKNSVKDVGTSQGLRDIYADRITDKLYDPKSSIPRSAYVEKGKKHFGNIKSSEFASSFDHRMKNGDPLLQGVGINSKYAKNPILTKQALERDVLAGFHPKGCTTIKSMIDHEMGHEIDKLLGRISDTDKFKAIVSKYDVAKDLSKYPVTAKSRTTMLRETLAEGWSEYLNNPTPRPLAREIGNMIKEEYAIKFGGK